MPFGDNPPLFRRLERFLRNGSFYLNLSRVSTNQSISQSITLHYNSTSWPVLMPVVVVSRASLSERSTATVPTISFPSSSSSISR